MDLFSEQAGLKEGKGKESLTDLEMSRARSNNLKDAISNIIEVDHALDVLSNNKDRFKRGAELEVLNTLFATCSMNANLNLRATAQMGNILDKLDPNSIDDTATTQALLDRNTNVTSRLVDTFSKLIALERNSGSRPFGNKDNSVNSIMYTKALDSAEEEKEYNKSLTSDKNVRQLTLEDIQNLKS